MPDKAQEYLAHTYSGKSLLKEHDPSDEGVWLVYGEDENPDMGGHHHQPLLGVYEGRLIDVVAYAVELPRWSTWGGGGKIERYREPKIQKITPESVAELQQRRGERERINGEIKALQERLKTLQD